MSPFLLVPFVIDRKLSCWHSTKVSIIQLTNWQSISDLTTKLSKEELFPVAIASPPPLFKGGLADFSSQKVGGVGPNSRIQGGPELKGGLEKFRGVSAWLAECFSRNIWLAASDFYRICTTTGNYAPATSRIFWLLTSEWIQNWTCIHRHVSQGITISSWYSWSGFWTLIQHELPTNYFANSLFTVHSLIHRYDTDVEKRL